MQKHRARPAAGTPSQFRQLQAALITAYEHSYLQHEHLKDVTVSSWEGFNGVPLTAHDAIMADDTGWLCGSLDQAVGRVATGDGRRWFDGSSWQMAVQWWARRLDMVRPGQKVLLAMPCQRDSYAAVIDAAVRARQAIPLPYGPIASLARWSELLRQQKVATVIGTPEPLLALAQYTDLNRIKVPVRNVVLWADMMAPDVAARIAKYWGCRQWRALTLNDGLMTVAFGPIGQPGLKVGGHWLCEILSPDGRMRLPAGQYGQLVVTSLADGMRPLIRYQTGRFGRLMAVPRGQALDPDIQPWPFSSPNQLQIDQALFQIEQVYDYQAVPGSDRWYFTLYALYDVYFSTERIARMLQSRLGIPKAEVRLVYRQDIDGPLPAARLAKRMDGIDSNPSAAMR